MSVFGDAFSRENLAGIFGSAGTVEHEQVYTIDVDAPVAGMASCPLEFPESRFPYDYSNRLTRNGSGDSKAKSVFSEIMAGNLDVKVWETPRAVLLTFSLVREGENEHLCFILAYCTSFGSCLIPSFSKHAKMKTLDPDVMKLSAARMMHFYMRQHGTSFKYKMKFEFLFTQVRPEHCSVSKWDDAYDFAAVRLRWGYHQVEKGNESLENKSYLEKMHGWVGCPGDALEAGTLFGDAADFYVECSKALNWSLPHKCSFLHNAALARKRNSRYQESEALSFEVLSLCIGDGAGKSSSLISSDRVIMLFNMLINYQDWAYALAIGTASGDLKAVGDQFVTFASLVYLTGIDNFPLDDLTDCVENFAAQSTTLLKKRISIKSSVGPHECTVQ